MPAQRTKPPFTNTWFWTIAGTFVLLALVPTIWTSIDLLAASWFTGPKSPVGAANWWWVELLNAYVPAAFRVVLVMGLVAWIVATKLPKWHAWRLPMAFLVIAGILGPGVVVNLVFKDQWQRARPYQVEHLGGTQKFSRAGVMTDQCDNNCSFVSGHVACGAFFVSLGLVHRRRRYAWATGGVVAGLTIGFARMAAVDHWFSDVLWAFPITLGTSWLVWRGLSKVYVSPSKTVG